MINGVALANRDRTVFCLGSDGSQQEGNDAEAARLAVAQNLNVKIIIDDNNVTIAGHPSEYLPGYNVPQTLAGHGLKVVTVQGEDIDALWGAFVNVITHQGPAASEPRIYSSLSPWLTLQIVISKRVMAPGVPDIQGSPHGHDVIPVKSALAYFKQRGYPTERYNAIENILLNIKPTSVPYLYIGSTRDNNANRVVFGEAVSDVLDGLSKEDAARKVMVIDSPYDPQTVYRLNADSGFRRSRRLYWFKGDPQKASRSVYPLRDHGTRKFLRCGRLWFRVRQIWCLFDFLRLP
jgi:Transketolase, thiamine diphosphate binding domain